MSTRHTPGPLGGLFFNGSAIRAPKHGPAMDSPDFPGSLVVARLYSDAMPEAHVYAATGRAMAAATELLDAAQAAEAVLGRQKWLEGSTDPEAVALFKLRNAIAKASGVSTVERILENGEHIGWVLSDGTARYFSDPGDAKALRAAGGAA